MGKKNHFKSAIKGAFTGMMLGSIATMVFFCTPASGKVKDFTQSTADNIATMFKTK